MYLAYAQHHTYQVPTLTSSMEIFPFVVPEAPNTSIAVSAVWDTGATRTFINSRLSVKLNLVPIEFQPVISATGNQMAGLVDISLKLPNGVYIPDIVIILTFHLCLSLRLRVRFFLRLFLLSMSVRVVSG